MPLPSLAEQISIVEVVKRKMAGVEAMRRSAVAQIALLREYCQALITAALNDPHRGMLHVLRHGFKFYGKKIPVAQFAPDHGLTPEIAERYAKNRLIVIRQVHYSVRNPPESIDLVIALNGLPSPRSN